MFRLRVHAHYSRPEPEITQPEPAHAATSSGPRRWHIAARIPRPRSNIAGFLAVPRIKGVPRVVGFDAASEQNCSRQVVPDHTRLCRRQRSPPASRLHAMRTAGRWLCPRSALRKAADRPYRESPSYPQSWSDYRGIGRRE